MLHTKKCQQTVKLRIRNNSIRLRLERGEVDALRDHGLVAASTGFPGGRAFGYAVESSPAIVSPGAFYSENALTVRLPETVVLGWANSLQVSIAGEQRLDDGTPLAILVEKDFACLAPREGEDDADMFPHPDASAGQGGC